MVRQVEPRFGLRIDLGPPGSARAAARYQQVRLVVLVGILALATSAAGFILYFHFQADESAYRSTPACASPSDAVTMNCRYAGPAQILGSSRTDQLRVTVQFSALSGKTFTARFPKTGEPAASALTVGISTEGELWSGKVSRLAGTPTSDNPESTSPDPFVFVGWAFLIAAVVVFVMAAALARHYTKMEPADRTPAG